MLRQGRSIERTEVVNQNRSVGLQLRFRVLRQRCRDLLEGDSIDLVVVAEASECLFVKKGAGQSASHQAAGDPVALLEWDRNDKHSPHWFKVADDWFALLAFTGDLAEPGAKTVGVMNERFPEGTSWSDVFDQFGLFVPERNP